MGHANSPDQAPEFFRCGTKILRVGRRQTDWLGLALPGSECFDPFAGVIDEDV